jgi:microcystin-dependent protein
VNGGADIHVASASISASGTIIASEAPAVTGAPGIGSLASGNTGSDTAHRNVQPTIIVNKMMRVL